MWTKKVWYHRFVYRSPLTVAAWPLSNPSSFFVNLHWPMSCSSIWKSSYNWTWNQYNLTQTSIRIQHSSWPMSIQNIEFYNRNNYLKFLPNKKKTSSVQYRLLLLFLPLPRAPKQTQCIAPVARRLHDDYWPKSAFKMISLNIFLSKIKSKTGFAFNVELYCNLQATRTIDERMCRFLCQTKPNQKEVKNQSKKPRSHIERI